MVPQSRGGRQPVRAQYSLGYAYYHGEGVPQDHEGAVAWYRKAAGQGDADAQCQLGNARSAEHDRKAAAMWYRKAAEQGHAEAQCSLCEAYYCGEGVTQDREVAVAWYRKAAGQGHAAAQCSHRSLILLRTRRDEGPRGRRGVVPQGRGARPRGSAVQPL